MVTCFNHRRRKLLRTTEFGHFLFDGFVVCCERLEVRQLKLHSVHSFARGNLGLHLVIRLTEAMATGSARTACRPAMPGDGAHDTVNDWQTTTDVFLSVREDARDVDHGRLIRQPTALLLLPALRNSLLLVASSSRQVNDVMVVSSGSTRTLIE